MSAAAMPSRRPTRPRSTQRAAQADASPASSKAGSSAVPGETTRTTPRRTSWREAEGRSSCSQIATRWPRPTSRARWPSTERTGTPARGDRSPPPIGFEVSAMSSSEATSLASSSNVS